MKEKKDLYEYTMSPSLKLFDGKICIGVNANLTGDAHGFHGQVFGVQFGVLQHGACRGEGVTAAGAYRHDSIVRLDDVAIAGQDERGFAISHDEHGFQMTQGAVLAPFLGKLDGGLLQIAGRLLQLAFETFEEGDG